MQRGVGKRPAMSLAELRAFVKTRLPAGAVSLAAGGSSGRTKREIVADIAAFNRRREERG